MVEKGTFHWWTRELSVADAGKLWRRELSFADDGKQWRHELSVADAFGLQEGKEREEGKQKKYSTEFEKALARFLVETLEKEKN